jgi:hypothetical protein
MSNSTEINWDDGTWNKINDAVVAKVLKVRTAQKVFPTMVLENPINIPNELINFSDLSIREGPTKELVELYNEFTLTNTQVGNEQKLKIYKLLQGWQLNH